MTSENQYREYRILLLEDDDNDADLLELELKKGKLIFNIKRVADKQGYLKALQDFAPDLIISDYRLPGYDGLAALNAVMEQCPDIPFIIVSGKIGDDLAVETIKRGAMDYILKDKLVYLLPSVDKALHNSEIVRIKNDLETRVKELSIENKGIQKTELRIKQIKKEIEELHDHLNELISLP